MKTWEMIKELTENPKKEFVSKTSTPTTAILEDGFIEFFDLLGNRFSHGTNVNIEWEEVKKPVSFIEAVASGRKIKVVHDDNKLLGYRLLDTLLRDLVRNHPMSHVREILLNGEFYTED